MEKDKIVSIEYVGEADTVDISVSGNNLFYANDILTHNCGYDVAPELVNISESIGLAATADFICSVYQEEEDAESGIIRMSLLKNRFGQNFGSSAFAIDYSTLTITEDKELNSLTNESESARNTLEDLCID